MKKKDAQKWYEQGYEDCNEGYDNDFENRIKKQGCEGKGVGVIILIGIILIFAGPLSLWIIQFSLNIHNSVILNATISLWVLSVMLWLSSPFIYYLKWNNRCQIKEDLAKAEE